MKIKKLLNFIGAAAACITFAAAGTVFASADTGAFTVTGGTDGTDYSYSNGVLTINNGADITISGTSTSDRIEVADGATANITFNGVNIDVSKTEDAAAFKIADDSKGDVTITLSGDNVLKSGKYCAGLQKNGVYFATLGKLTITGEGSLYAKGGYEGAGIGGGSAKTTSNITIEGGTITADGNQYGAGIGGGKNGNASNITIKDGTVAATGSYFAAGIGGGWYGNGSDITIEKGAVNAIGGDQGAGIGGGVTGTGSNITIKGGAVTANGAGGGAGIGGGAKSNTGSLNIVITGGSVKAVGSKYQFRQAPSIGNGASDEANGTAVTPTLADSTTPVYLLEIGTTDATSVTIDKTTYTNWHTTESMLYVYLTGETHVVKVGDTETIYLFDSTTSTFKTPDLTITATKNSDTITYGDDYTYINGVLTILSDNAVTIKNADGVTTTTDHIEVAKDISANITLAGVNIDVSATTGTKNNVGYDEYVGFAALRIADNSEGNVTITLADNTVNILKGGYECAGLQKNGAYIRADKGKLTIQGGTNGTGALEATGGYFGAGIGGGRNGTGSNIIITGGVITAQGAYGGAGIGGGYSTDGFNGTGTNITISGGFVTAKCGEFGFCDIGGISSSDIIISNGSVKVNSIGDKPTDGNNNNVYLLKIENVGTSEVKIDDLPYPKQHIYYENGVKKTEDVVYAYLKKVAHIVTIGGEETLYAPYNENYTYVFKPAELSIKPTNSNDTLILGTDYAYSNEYLYVMTNKPVTIANVDPSAPTSDYIAISKDADITLAGVNINSYNNAFVTNASSTTIILADNTENVLKSSNWGGLYMFEEDNPLEIKGNGSLEVISGDTFAGISGKNITISGGVITATGGKGGAGIGGYSDSNIVITGGSVKAIAGEGANAIGGGEGKDAVTPTLADKTTPVYLLEVDTTGATSVKIDDKTYTDWHTSDNKFYAYLTAGTLDEPHVVEINGVKTKWHYNGSQWCKVIDAPAKDETVFTYNGEPQTYTIPESDFYTVTGNEQTNAGPYKVTVTLATGCIWSDGTTVVKEYDFIIGKAKKTVEKPTAAAITYGQTLGESKLSDGWEWVKPSESLNVGATLREARMIITDLDYNNYDFTLDEFMTLVTSDTEKYISRRVTVTVNKAACGISKPTATDIRYGQSLSESVLSDGWKWVEDTATIPTVGTKSYKAEKYVSNLDTDNYTYNQFYVDEVNKTISIYVKVTVNKANPRVTVYTDKPSDIAGKTITLGASVENTDNKTITVLPEVEYSYAIGDTVTWCDGSSFVIPEGTPTGTVITVYAITVEDENYISAFDSTTVIVTDCKHVNVSADLTSDGSKHWNACEYCGAHMNETACSGGAATCVKKAVCEICGNEYGTFDTTKHEHVSEAWSSDGTNHWHECTDCHGHLNETACSGGSATCVKKAVCAVCGSEYGTFDTTKHEHVSEAWSSDETSHWHVCEDCSGLVGKEQHSYGADGKCVCGKEKPAEITTTTPSGKPTPDTRPSGPTTPSGSTTTTTPNYIGPRPNTVTTTATPTTTTTTITDTTTTPVYDEPFIVGDNGKIGWEVIEEQIDETPDGEKLIIDMNGTTKLPETILEAIMERDVTIVLEMDNGFAWTINGADVTDPTTVDLAVTTGSSIKAKVINALTGECSYIEITLKHNGEFGFTATLTVDLGKSNKGLFANLYYYKDNGKFDLISSGKIGKNGKADLEFTHASEYVIVIDSYDHAAESDVASDAEEKIDNVEKPNETPNDVVIEVPTDEDGNPITGVTISFSAVILAGAVVMATKKKRK